MPTEKRSSNTEMVSAKVCGYTPGQSQVELRLDQGRPLPGWLELGESVTIQPAEQHHGEPVAWLARAVDTDGTTYRQCVSTNQLTERDAKFAWGEGVMNRCSVVITPLGPLADPGEVERIENERAEQWRLRRDAEADRDTKAAVIAELLAQLDELEKHRIRLRDNNVEALKENMALQQKLAERDALLRHLYDHNELSLGDDQLILAALSASAEPSAPPEQSEWRPLTAPGQIKEGDRLSFRVGSSFICARARQIIAPGTDKEEVVYNRKKNQYFLTSMAVDGTSSHKNVMVARVTA